jgi:peptide/nickel transport system permease protein
MTTVAPSTSRWAIVRRQFFKKRTAVWGLRGTVALLLLAVYAPVIASGLPLWWREGGRGFSPWISHLFDVIYWQQPVDRIFNTIMILLPMYLLGALALRIAVKGPERGRWLVRLRLAVLGLLVVVGFLQTIEAAFVSSKPFVDWRARAAVLRQEDPSFEETWTLVPYGHGTQLPELSDRFRGTMDFERGHRHLLGTDELGRDVFARILYGTRISLTIGLVAVFIYTVIGTFLGALAGYFRGWVDTTIMRVIEVMICIPGLILILIIISLFQSRSIFMIMFAIGIVSWTGIARLVRGEYLRERTLDYVTAARAMGLGNRRIAFRHILPNAFAPVLVAATFGICGAILTESTLAFLGLGDVTVPSWGRILDDGRIHRYWHLIIPPSVAIFVTVTSLSLVGDGLRDALDPKLRA